MSVKGTFYSCATPIGNLSDCTFRLIDILSQVQLIAAENTQTTQKLLNHYNIKKRTIHVDMHKEESAISQIKQVLDKGQSVAYVSEAGTPNIADPGARLIEELHILDYLVCPIPGPSSVSALLSVSGVIGNHYTFAGFVPKTNKSKTTFFDRLQTYQVPVVCFETARRLQETIDVLAQYPIAKITIGKELTKSFETILHGTYDYICAQLENIPIKGEWVLLITFMEMPPSSSVQAFVSNCKEAGLNKQQAIRLGNLSYRFSKNEIYKEWITDHRLRIEPSK